MHLPKGEGVRFDGGIREGQAVTPAFDSMLAKLICYSATRENSVSKMDKALSDFILLGVPTNIDFLGCIMKNDVFKSGKLNTGFLVDHSKDLMPVVLSEEEETLVISTALLGDSDFRISAFEVPEPYASIGPWQN